MSDKHIESSLVDNTNGGAATPVTWGGFVGGIITATAIQWTVFSFQIAAVERGLARKIDAHMQDVNNTDEQLSQRIYGIHGRLNSWYEGVDKEKAAKDIGPDRRQHLEPKDG